jgi:Flp pilus assembly pilin Flp
MIKHTVFEFWHEEEGQDMVEYALLLGFVALAGVAVLGSIRTSINSIWSTIDTSLATGAS